MNVSSDMFIKLCKNILSATSSYTGVSSVYLPKSGVTINSSTNTSALQGIPMYAEDFMAFLNAIKGSITYDTSDLPKSGSIIKAEQFAFLLQVKEDITKYRCAGCGNSCYSGCSGSCSGCSGDCGSSCGGCSGCKGTCKTGCYGECSGNCGDNCSDTADGGDS